jgi:hypothetical protein
VPLANCARVGIFDSKFRIPSSKPGAENRRARVGAQRDSKTAEHQIESFSGAESGTEWLEKGGENVGKPIEMKW